MNAKTFFAQPPKAKRAVLSPYGSATLKGQYGIRIELQPLVFSAPPESASSETDTDIILDHLDIPSIVPKELEHSRYRPNAQSYEGSCYFLGQHNWVDLNEIRFLGASGPRIRAEYDLIIHLPIALPDEYPLVLTVSTKVEPDTHKFVPRQPKYVPSIGTFTETHEHFWECPTTYHGCPVTVQLHAERGQFRRIIAFVKSVLAENAITPTDILKEISERIGELQWKFDHFKVRTRFTPERLAPNWFSFYLDDRSDELTLSIRLSDPADTGQWFLRFHGTEAYDLEWIPHEALS
ncbi:MAG TPA: hypothetical protein VFV87_19620 [Pirellulaceae bacterium]|nr:hypothetical protein [Pirellulaceae bacterium]